jgi:hypothetical protein
MKKTWQQWSALEAFIVYMTCLGCMFVFKSYNVVFFSLLGIQILSVLWIWVLYCKWPKGGQHIEEGEPRRIRWQQK